MGGTLLGQVYFPGEADALTDAPRILQSVQVNLIQLGDCSFSRAFNLYTWSPAFVNTFLSGSWKGVRK